MFDLDQIHLSWQQLQLRNLYDCGMQQIQTIVYKHIQDTAPVMSLDFHPKKTDLFCFCDHDNVIQYWITNPFSCTRSSKVCNLLFFSSKLSVF
ncbi:hypothetical protein FF1_035490 [Malus domestica]